MTTDTNPSSHKVILVVEDDPFYSSIFHRKLSFEGFDVLLASDGQQGIKVACEKQPNLILLDMIMPVKDGITTLKEMKADDSLKNIPVIILSNLGQEENMKETTDLGAVDYIVKSNMSVQEMVDKVKKYV